MVFLSQVAAGTGSCLKTSWRYCQRRSHCAPCSGTFLRTSSRDVGYSFVIVFQSLKLCADSLLGSFEKRIADILGSDTLAQRRSECRGLSLCLAFRHWVRVQVEMLRWIAPESSFCAVTPRKICGRTHSFSHSLSSFCSQSCSLFAVEHD